MDHTVYQAKSCVSYLGSDTFYGTETRLKNKLCKLLFCHVKILSLSARACVYMCLNLHADDTSSTKKKNEREQDKNNTRQ